MWVICIYSYTMHEPTTATSNQKSTEWANIFTKLKKASTKIRRITIPSAISCTIAILMHLWKGKRSDMRTREKHKSDIEHPLKSWCGRMCHLVKRIMENKSPLYKGKKKNMHSSFLQIGLNSNKHIFRKSFIGIQGWKLVIHILVTFLLRVNSIPTFNQIRVIPKFCSCNF